MRCLPKLSLCFSSWECFGVEEKLKIDMPVLVRGQRGEEDGAPKLAISNITALEDVKVKLPTSMRIMVVIGLSASRSGDAGLSVLSIGCRSGRT